MAVFIFIVFIIILLAIGFLKFFDSISNRGSGTISKGINDSDLGKGR